RPRRGSLGILLLPPAAFLGNDVALFWRLPEPALLLVGFGRHGHVLFCGHLHSPYDQYSIPGAPLKPPAALTPLRRSRIARVRRGLSRRGSCSCRPKSARSKAAASWASVWRWWGMPASR